MFWVCMAVCPAVQAALQCSARTGREAGVGNWSWHTFSASSLSRCWKTEPQPATLSAPCPQKLGKVTPKGFVVELQSPCRGERWKRAGKTREALGEIPEEERGSSLEANPVCGTSPTGLGSQGIH